MARQFVGELKDGDQIDETFLLAEKQLRANRNADLYLLSQLRDKSGTISGLMWNVTESQCADFDAGDFVSVRGKCQLYQGGLQIILTHIRRAEPASLDMGDFELRPEKNVEDLLTACALESVSLQSRNDPNAYGIQWACFLITDAGQSL